MGILGSALHLEAVQIQAGRSSQHTTQGSRLGFKIPWSHSPTSHSLPIHLLEHPLLALTPLLRTYSCPPPPSPNTCTGQEQPEELASLSVPAVALGGQHTSEWHKSALLDLGWLGGKFWIALSSTTDLWKVMDHFPLSD